MSKITKTFIFIFGFLFYVLIHDTCNSLVTDIVKCEQLTQKVESCSNPAHAGDSVPNDKSGHACGCVNTFFVSIYETIIESFPKVVYEFVKPKFILSNFTFRIERPPISLA